MWGRPAELIEVHCLRGQVFRWKEKEGTSEVVLNQG